MSNINHKSISREERNLPTAAPDKQPQFIDSVGHHKFEGFITFDGKPWPRPPYRGEYVAYVLDILPIGKTIVTAATAKSPIASSKPDPNPIALAEYFELTVLDGMGMQEGLATLQVRIKTSDFIHAQALHAEALKLLEKDTALNLIYEKVLELAEKREIGIVATLWPTV